MIRVALYARVSTEEQVLHGLSIDAQKESLEKYAKENSMQIIDFYVDEGISARKKYVKRKEFVRLLEDVKQKKIDIILFTKLDRWFRNISEYYKVQEMLEQYNVNWKAIFENYDTTTASGRLHTNIMLSVAQDEADRTSERIKTVFKHKIDNGELTNISIPYGYSVENKKLVIDEDKANRVKAVFNAYELKRSVLATQRWYIESFSENVSYEFISRMLKREIYIGKKRNNVKYCDPIISKDQFERINKKEKPSFSRLGSTGLVYVFSGLTTCDTCKHMMNGVVCYNPKPRKYYSCRHGAHFTICTHNKRCREDNIEKKALDELEKYITTKLSSISVVSKKPKISEKYAISKKLKRLKDLYVADLIQIEDYKIDYELYISQLEKIEQAESGEPVVQDISDVIKFVVSANYKELYYKMDDEHKRLFWHKTIKQILITDNNEVRIIFK